MVDYSNLSFVNLVPISLLFPFEVYGAVDALWLESYLRNGEMTIDDFNSATITNITF